MNKIFQRMGEETPPVQKTAKQLEKEAKKAAEKAAKLEKLAAKQAKQVSGNVSDGYSHYGTLTFSVTIGKLA